MNLELRWLKSFVTVAEEMHFSRAAQRLNLAQPALTAQIQQLEEAVGAPLIERTNRISGLTAAGAALLPEARRLLERAGALATLAGRAMRGASGVLRVGLIPPASTPGVAEVFRRYAGEVPGVEISVRLGHQDALMAALVAGELDLVLGRPEQPPARSGLRERRLFVEEQGVLLRRDDPRAAAEVVRLDALDGASLLLLRGNLHFGQLLLELAAREGVALRPQHSADDFPALHWMVQAGFGVAPCSLRLSESVPNGLVVRPLRPMPPRLHVNAIWRGRVPSPPTARWLQMAGAAFA
ncbi:MAG: LysR family transcriptional regulator [Verrucomicrobia bacterium]|nr:LysR family transcriptional regulator [Verrucomicrobiota bacterium]